MTAYVSELSYMLLTFAAGYAIQIYPVWRIRDMSARTVLVTILCLTAVQGAGLLLVKQFWSVDIVTLNTYIAVAGLPTSAAFPFFVLGKRAWQKVFLLSICLAYHLIPGGISNYAYDNWFVSFSNPLFAACLLKAALIIMTLPFVLHVLRRLIENAHIGKAVMFWRLFWLIPALFFASTMMSSNYLFLNLGTDISFVLMRLLTFAILLLTCYLLEAAVRQISEAEAARRKAEELAAKTDFYRILSHTLRTPLTVVSTNVQTALRRPEEASELLTQSQEEIMKMAEMIDDALKDDEKGAGE